MPSIPSNRLFSADYSILALYPDSETPENESTPLMDFLAIFRNVSVTIATKTVDGTATWEWWDYPIPVRASLRIKVNSYIDPVYNGTYKNLWDIYEVYGSGPYWMWLCPHTGSKKIRARVLIETGDLDASDDAQEQTFTLVAQGQPTNANMGS